MIDRCTDLVPSVTPEALIIPRHVTPADEDVWFISVFVPVIQPNISDGFAIHYYLFTNKRINIIEHLSHYYLLFFTCY